MPFDDRVLLLVFGGTMIAAIAAFLSFGRLALIVAREEGWHVCIRSREFRLALWLMLASFGLAGNTAVRVHDAIRMQHFAGSTPVLLAMFITSMWLAWSGFTWDATARHRVPWYVYVGLVLTWTVVVVWLLP